MTSYEKRQAPDEPGYERDIGGVLGTHYHGECIYAGSKSAKNQPRAPGYTTAASPAAAAALYLGRMATSAEKS